MDEATDPVEQSASSASAGTFTYDPLTSDEHIRLLQVQLADDGDLHCNLTPALLRDDDKPRYYAL